MSNSVIDVNGGPVDINELMEHEHVIVIDGRLGRSFIGSFQTKRRVLRDGTWVTVDYGAGEVLRFLQYLRDVALSQRVALGIA